MAAAFASRSAFLLTKLAVADATGQLSSAHELAALNEQVESSYADDSAQVDEKDSSAADELDEESAEGEVADGVSTGLDSAASGQGQRMMMRRERGVAGVRHAAESLKRLSLHGHGNTRASLVAVGSKGSLHSVDASASKSADTEAVLAAAHAVPDQWTRPNDVRDSDGICDQQETEIEDDMQGNIRSFSLHKPLCHKSHVLKSWRLFRAGTISRYKIQYTCCYSAVIGECRYNQTDLKAPANGLSTEAYYEHKPQCFEKKDDPSQGHIVMVQRGFHQQIRESDTEGAGANGAAVQFQFWCCQIESAGECRQKETPQTSSGRGHVAFLERHELECGKNEAISSWQLVPGNITGMMKFRYSCCPYKPDQYIQASADALQKVVKDAAATSEAPSAAAMLEAGETQS